MPTILNTEFFTAAGADIFCIYFKSIANEIDDGNKLLGLIVLLKILIS